MQPLSSTADYTAAEVAAALHAPAGSRRLTYRFEVLDSTNRHVGDLKGVIGGKVTNNALADVKRQASLDMLDAASLDFLSDRLKPYARLTMPDRTRVVPQPPLVSWVEQRRNLVAVPRPSGTYAESGWALAYAATNSVDGWLVANVTAPVTAYVFSGRSTEPVVVGERYALRIKMLVTAPETVLYVRASAHKRTGNVYYTQAGSGANTVAITPGVEQEIVVLWDATEAMPANELDIAVVTAGANGAFFAAPAGFSWRFTELAIERVAPETATAPAYFDGDSVAPAGYRYRWLGTARTSESVYEQRVLTPTPPVVIPDTGPGFVEWPLGVFLLEAPDRELKSSGIVSRTVKGHDQLIVLADDRTPTRRSFSAGTAYTAAVQTLAGEAGVATTILASPLTMPATMEWEPGTSRLRIINDLLAAINYESASFDEAGLLVGRPYLSPAQRSPEYRYAADAESVIRATGLSQSLDVFGVANEWTLVVSEADRPPLVATYTNNNPASPTSTVARGRTISDFRDNEDAPDLATLQAKAQRLAFEASQVIERVSFDTLAMPFHSNADVLELDVPRLGLRGVFSEQSWELPLKAGAPMKHTARRVVTV